MCRYVCVVTQSEIVASVQSVYTKWIGSRRALYHKCVMDTNNCWRCVQHQMSNFLYRKPSVARLAKFRMILNLPGVIPLTALTYILSVSPTLMDRINGYLNQDPEDIEKMRVAGRLAAEVLEMIEPYVKPGVSTGELDRICNDYIVNEQHAVSACLGYHGYPKSVCISINEVVCHGIPDDAKLLKDGDIVNIDVTVIDGFHGDTSKMFIVGKPTIMGERLCRITQESLYLALRMVKRGINLREIGAAIQKFVEAEGFSVVREYCGHGIGRGFHEEPQVLHYDSVKPTSC